MRPAWLEINLESLAHNYAVLSQKNPNAKVIGIVKANGYGHGAVEIGRELLNLGAWGLGVATVGEVLELRSAGIESPVLLMGSLHPSSAKEAAEAGCIATISTLEAGDALNQQGRKTEVHLKFDTGMSRIGFQLEEMQKVKEAISSWNNLSVTGIYSHFADAESNFELTQIQIQHFSTIKKSFGPEYQYHLSNSAGCLAWPGVSGDFIRPGIALYGLAEGFGLKPIARLRAKPTLVKKLEPGRLVGYGATYQTQNEEWIATIPIGYADGYPRGLSNKAAVKLADQYCDVVGRVSMDNITVKVEGEVSLEDVFEIATADFDPRTSVCGWAQMTDTISYEPAVRFAVRLPRIFVGGVQMNKPVEATPRDKKLI